MVNEDALSIIKKAVYFRWKDKYIFKWSLRKNRSKYQYITKFLQRWIN